MSTDSQVNEAVEKPSLAEKVRFLRQGRDGETVAVETHMSWVFLTGDLVFKLKKPVRFPYLDFSTVRRRELACRSELRLNRRLAPEVYLDVVPLALEQGRLHRGPGEHVVDWLVVMRRLGEARMLERMLDRHAVHRSDAVRLAGVLARFYRGTRHKFILPGFHLREWDRNLKENRALLFMSGLGLSAGRIRKILHIQERFLAAARGQFKKRALAGRIVDGHGDLRPEHIWLGDPLQIIDCLEFNDRLRAVDPFDEIAYLSVECERLGAPKFGKIVVARLASALHDEVPKELFHFYRCYRATLRARLSIAHLLEPHPRTPEKWPKRACEYLHIAEKDAAALERFVRKREGRPKRSPRAAAG